MVVGNSFACGPSYQSQVLLQHRPLATLGSRWGGTIIFVFFWSAFWDLHVLVLKPKSERTTRSLMHLKGELATTWSLRKCVLNPSSYPIFLFSETVRLGVQRPSPVVKQHRCHGQERKRCTTWDSRGPCFWWRMKGETRTSVLIYVRHVGKIIENSNLLFFFGFLKNCFLVKWPIMQCVWIMIWDRTWRLKIHKTMVLFSCLQSSWVARMYRLRILQKKRNGRRGWFYARNL